MIIENEYINTIQHQLIQVAVEFYNIASILCENVIME